MLLDDFMPDFEFFEYHEVDVAAPVEAGWAAATDVAWGEVPLFRILFGIRSGRAFRRDRPILDQMLSSGFTLLAEDPPRELVFGVVGRFWRLTGGLRDVPPEDFASFSGDRYVKGATNFLVTAAPGGCKVSTETRVQPTDVAARRRFYLYWSVVRGGSAAIRVAWLRAIKKRAETSSA